MAELPGAAQPYSYPCRAPAGPWKPNTPHLERDRLLLREELLLLLLPELEDELERERLRRLSLPEEL